MTQLKLIITDFDGVILESEPAKLEAYQECFSEFPHHVDQFMAYHKENLTGGRYEKFKYFYENILKLDYTQDRKKWISDKFNKIMFRKVCSSPFVPGALDFIESYSRKVPLWLVTGTPKQELLKVLKYLKIEKFFEKIFSTPPSKSTILADILNETGVDPSESVFIGDMNNDLKAAQENSIPFIARRSNEKFHGPRIYELEDLTNINKILQAYE